MNKSVYTRPNKPTRIPVTRRSVDDFKPVSITEKPIILDASSECHVTPPDVAERMADYLGERNHVLEPSAGTGNLLVAARAIKKTAIERNHALCKAIEERTGIKPLCEDFLDYKAPGAYDGIIMNPPFSQVEKHIKHAIDCLEIGGALVALVPITFKTEKYGAETIEELPSDTFTTCKVSTKIIIIVK